MIPVSQQNVALMGFLPWRINSAASPARQCRSQNQKVAVGSGQFDARRIAAEVVGAWSGVAIDPLFPETYLHAVRPFVGILASGNSLGNAGRQ
jgi:hypothetical protein